MTIRLLSPISVAGVAKSIGDIITGDPAWEADQVNANNAVYTYRDLVQGEGLVPAQFQVKDGNVTGLLDPYGRRYVPARTSGQTAYPAFNTKRPLLATLVPYGTVSAIDVHTSMGGAATIAVTASSSITWNGRPAVKATVSGAASDARMDIGISNYTLGAGDAQSVVTRIPVFAIKPPSGKTISAVQYFIGNDTSNYHVIDLVQVATMPNGLLVYSRLTPGVQSTVGTPNLANACTLCKLRITAGANPADGDIWYIGEGYALPLPTPTVVWTNDDGYVEWTWLAAEAAKRGIPMSFGVAMYNVDTEISQSALLAIAKHSSGLFELTDHARVNSSYATLGLGPYMADVNACRDYLISLGCDPIAARCHQYVQGSNDQTLRDRMKAEGYLAAREVGSINRRAVNEAIAIEGTSCDYKYKIPATTNLGNTYNLSTVQSHITAAAQYGSAFIMGHRYAAAAGPNTWVAGYDASYGALNLMDWLAQKRDESGWQLLRWSEWQSRIHSGYLADWLV